MRVLLLADNAYGEPSSGAARSVQTMVEWLAEAGHVCTAVTSGRFEQTVQPDIAAFNDGLGVPLLRDPAPGPRPTARYRLRGVDVVSVETVHAGGAAPDAEADGQVLEAFLEAIDAGADVVLAYGGHVQVHVALAHAKARGCRVVFTVRGWGYDDRRFFANADRVLVNSAFAVRAYAAQPGVAADWLPSPLRWADIAVPADAPAEARAFLTFINPLPHKGSALFARLADMLGRRRPDIPVLIVQSMAGAAELADLPGLSLGQYPQIMVSPAVSDMRQVYALTRVLLVPSLFQEPFGRVAAEAMINGIPPIVSDRGALPETVGAGGIVVPVPAWMQRDTRRVPEESEVEPWFVAVARLWDDPAAYAEASEAARAEAERLYGEAGLRQRHVDYFTDPGPFPPLFPDA